MTQLINDWGWLTKCTLAIAMIATLGCAIAPRLVADESKELKTIDVETYDVSVILERLTSEAGVPAEQHAAWLKHRVGGFLPAVDSVGQSDLTNAADRVVSVEAADGSSVTMPLDENGCGVILIGKSLTVAAPRSCLAEVARSLETIAQFGLRQIVIRTRVIRGEQAELQNLSIRWQHVESQTRVAESKHPSVGETPVSTAGFNSSAGRLDAIKVSPTSYVAMRNPAATAEDARLPKLNEASKAGTRNWAEASSLIERSTPVLFTLLTPEENKQISNELAGLTGLERVMQPSVVVFNGQLATVSDCVERPFVTGIKPVRLGEAGKQQIDFAPSIRVYPEGTTMLMRPEMIEGTRLSLSFFLELCKIRDVETLDLPRFDGRGTMTIQMPEVASTRFRTRIEMPINHCLAVSTFETDEEGNKKNLLVLCHCSVADVDKSPAK